MTQVYATADAVRFGGGPEIRLPTVAGYVALKLKAWIDRSAVYNEKDAPDLGLALADATFDREHDEPRCTWR